MGRSGRGNSSDHILHLLVPRYLLPDSLENLPRRSYIARRLRKCFRIWSGRWESNPRPKLGKLILKRENARIGGIFAFFDPPQMDSNWSSGGVIAGSSPALGSTHLGSGRER